MSETTTYVAFPSSKELFELTDGFIARMGAGATRPEPDALERIMCLFVDEAVDAFFTRPTEAAGLSGGLAKIVTFTADTIKKATHLVVRSTTKKLDIRQNRDCASYMDTMRAQLDVNGAQVWHVAFPVTDEMALQGRAALTLALEGNQKEAVPKVMEFFHNLTEIAIYWYFEEPMRLMDFGPILRKVASVGIATVKKASHSAVDKIIPKMEGKQMQLSAAYTIGLLVDGPAPAR